MTYRRITPESAVAIFASAFAPLRCVAEVWDYHQKIRYRIFDLNDKAVVQGDDITRDMFSDDRRLESILFQLRARLEAKGFKLSAWTFPDVAG